MARIKRGSQVYHADPKDYPPGSDPTSKKGRAAKQTQIEKETKAHNARKAKEKRRQQRLAERKRATVGGIKDDPSNTKGETKPKRIGAVRRAFARVPLAAFRLGGGGGGGAGRK